MRKFINVRDLDIDLIDRINPFDAAYAVLAKAMDEKTLRQVRASIAAKQVSIPEDEAQELARACPAVQERAAACRTSPRRCLGEADGRGRCRAGALPCAAKAAEAKEVPANG